MPNGSLFIISQLELKPLGSGEVLDMYPCYWYAIEASKKMQWSEYTELLTRNIKEESQGIGD